MKFIATPLEKVFVIELNPLEDSRGYLTRTYCEDTFKKNDLAHHYVQESIVHNSQKGTLRGMHYQSSPCGEDKILQCLTGKIFDVILDIRKHSSTFGQYFTLTLQDNDNKILYIPKGCAHGYVTLVDNVNLFYKMSNQYIPTSASGILWNSQSLDIPWPIEMPIMSEQDKLWPTFNHTELYYD